MNQPTATLALTKLTQPATKFFVMYGDRETGIRGRHFAEALGAGLGDGADRVLALWRCEMLDLEELADEAAREAHGIDFLILSLSGDTGLSPTIKHWLERWLEAAAGSTASLVVLFDPSRCVLHHAEAIRHYLRQVATTSGVDFFAHRGLARGSAAMELAA